MIDVKDHKLLFSKDQIVSSTHMVRNFREIREQVKDKPCYIQGRNGEIDMALVDFAELEAMAAELEALRLEHFYKVAAERVHEMNANPKYRFHDVDEVLGHDWRDGLDEDSLSDEELFE